MNTERAKACIVTVSTGVLAGEGLRFDPPLPSEKLAAFHGIPMGSYNHIALQFRENVFGTGPDGPLYYRIDEKLAGSPLPNLWKPKKGNFVRVEEIPLLGSGKVDLKAAQEIAGAA